jgi:capsular exopolysaccharide synthesis family protein
MPSPDRPDAPEYLDESAAETQPDAHHLMQVLLDRIWIIALCVVVASLAAAVYLRRAPRIYQATATVQVEQQEQKVMSKLEPVMQEDLKSDQVLNTIVQKLRSRPLLEQVLESNRLDLNPAFLGPLEDPPPDKEALVRRLDLMVKTSLRRNTRLVDVTVSGTDPALTALIANSVVGEFSSQDFDWRNNSKRTASSYLQEETTRLKTKLELSEQSLQKYREEVGSVSIQQGENSLTPKLLLYNNNLTESRAEMLRLKAVSEQINALTNRLDDLLTLPQIATEPALVESRKAHALATATFAATQMRYKEKHPKYQQAAQQLEEARRTLTKDALRLPDTYRMAYEAAQSTAKNAEAAMKEAEQEALRLSSQAIRFNLLLREVESDRALYTSLVNRVSETSLSTDLRAEKIRIMQPAIVPRVPSSPKVMLILVAGVMAGLMGGLVIVFGLHSLDRSIQSVDQAEAALGVPVLNVIPRLKGIKTDGPRLVTGEESNHAGAEAFRTLRTALSMLGRAEERRTFLFTSTVPQEGKTFTSINYAASLAQQGLKTLVVDADLRRPSVEEYLTGDDGHHPGLTEYLTGQKKLDELLQTIDGHPNFFWMAAGKQAPNPAELLAQNALKDFLAEALQRFDRVVVDSAPVTAVSDTLTIAASCQTTVLVIRSHVTPRKPIQRTLQLLKKAGGNVCGVVLNLEPRHWAGSYYYRDSYYYQSSYGGYGKDRDGRRKKKSRRKQTAKPATKLNSTDPAPPQ